MTRRELHVTSAHELISLIHELLDAHVDTLDLEAGSPDDLRWAAHADYLRALQRKGKEIVAHTTIGADWR